MTGVIGLSVLLLPLAQDWYVDGDAACGGDGSDENPFCDLATAFSADIAPGDRIRIRDAANRYEGASMFGPDGSGTSVAPVVLGPDDGASPVFRSPVVLRDISHWTVEGITFDGTGIGNPPETAMQIWGLFESVAGITVQDVRVHAWEPDGNSASPVINIFVNETDPPITLTNLTVQRVMIDSGRGQGIRVSRAMAPHIVDNDISGLRCSVTAIDDHHLFGIQVNNSPGTVIEGNRIHDFPPGCDLGALVRIQAINVLGSDGGRITRNLIHDIPGSDLFGDGIHLHGSATNFVVDHNVVLDVAGCGLCAGVDYGSGHGTRFINNTVARTGDAALQIIEATDVEVTGNILIGSGTVAIDVDDDPDPGVGLVMDHNLLLNPDSPDAVGRWGDNVNLDFAEWQAACGCDAGSANEDPMLASDGLPTDVTPAADGPAVDGSIEVIGISEAFHGDAVDIGAVEPPRVVAASIAEATPDRIDVALDNRVAPPLQPTAGCAGWSVDINGESVGLVDCVTEDEETVIELAAPAVEGDRVILVYAGAPITDSAAIGGGLGGHMPPAQISVDNGAPPAMGTDDGDTDDGGSTGAADDTGSDGGTGSFTTGQPGTSGGGVGSSSTGDGGADGDDGDEVDDGGCACAHRARPGLGWAAFVLALARRRRKKT